MRKLTEADLDRAQAWREQPLQNAEQASSGWPMGMPPGPVTLPGTGRTVYWTGRVAIGLRHQPSRSYETPVPHSTLWLQELLLGGAKQ
jgi:hypothetical protein